MRRCVPEFNRIVAPLSSALEAVYQRAGRRTKQAVQKVAIDSTVWNQEQDVAFHSMKQALHKATTLAHPDPEMLLCLLTDASDAHWAGVLTQIPEHTRDLDSEEQPHQPLSFLSGSFKGSTSRWSTAEKEAFAIVASVTRLDYLLLTPKGFSLFTDHKNLTYIFNPAATDSNIRKHVANKVERWAMKLSAFKYTIVHIPGEKNIWADLLSRWGAPGISAPTSTNIARLRVAALFTAPIAPDFDPDFSWPSHADIKTAQEKGISKGGENIPVQTSRGLLCNAESAVWIPSSDVSLQIRICVIGHCGRGGHRGADTTFRNISSCFYWTTMKSDIYSFCNSCLHCVSTSGGLRIPRPMAHALHAQKPNEVLHFDYLFMGKSDSDFQYILIIKDDASSFVWLEPCASADAQTTIAVLLKWFASFGVALTWISDRGSHFKNSVMAGLNRQLHAHHHFTTPYCPQPNGTVETVCKETLRCCRALLSEFRMKDKEWPAVVRVVQSVLNHSVRPVLGNRAPVTAFTGLPADNPLRTLLPPSAATTHTVSEIHLKKIMHIDNLLKSLEEIHRDVAERKTRRREQAVLSHNKKTHVCNVNFTVGDYVLVAQRLRNSGHKLRVKWRGPRRVVRADSELIFEVEDLIAKTTALVHANRIKFYSDSKINLTEELLDTVENNNPHFQTVSKILDFRYNADLAIYQVLIKWRRFSSEEPGWEPFDTMREDIPQMLQKFLDTFHDQDLVALALSS